MEEFTSWLNSNRKHRDHQNTLNGLFNKIKSNNSHSKEEGMEEMVLHVRSLKDQNLDVFLTLQDIQENNVSYAVWKCILEPSNSGSVSTSMILHALDIIQGCSLLHHPSKQLVGVECRGIKLLLTRLEASVRLHGSKVTPKAEETERIPLSKRTSSIIEQSSVDGAVVVAILDCLLALLVDHELCQVAFKQRSGVAYIVDVITDSHATKEVRAKAAECLLFLVRYFTQSKDDHLAQVEACLGEKLTKALIDSTQSTHKGADKFETFLSLVDFASSS